MTRKNPPPMGPDVSVNILEAGISGGLIWAGRALTMCMASVVKWALPEGRGALVHVRWGHLGPLPKGPRAPIILALVGLGVGIQVGSGWLYVLAGDTGRHLPGSLWSADGMSDRRRSVSGRPWWSVAVCREARRRAHNGLSGRGRGRRGEKGER